MKIRWPILLRVTHEQELTESRRLWRGEYETEAALRRQAQADLARAETQFARWMGELASLKVESVEHVHYLSETRIYARVSANVIADFGRRNDWPRLIRLIGRELERQIADLVMRPFGQDSGPDLRQSF